MKKYFLFLFFFESRFGMNERIYFQAFFVWWIAAKRFAINEPTTNATVDQPINIKSKSSFNWSNIRDGKTRVKKRSKIYIYYFTKLIIYSFIPRPYANTIDVDSRPVATVWIPRIL